MQTVVASLSGPNFAEEVKLAEGAAGCLQALAQGHKGCQEAIAEYGGVEAMVAAMVAHPKAEKLLQVRAIPLHHWRGAVDVSNSARELLACLSLNAACPQYAASTFDRLGLEVHPEDEALSVRASAALEESRERWPKSFSA